MKAYVLHTVGSDRLVDGKIPTYPSCLPDYAIVESVTPKMGIRAPSKFVDTCVGTNQHLLDIGWCIYVSHYMGMLDQHSKHPDEDLLIMEDDVVFEPKFDEYYSNFMKMVPDDWDVIYFGGTPRRYKPTEVVPNVLRPRLIVGTECYMCRPKAVEHLLKRYENLKSRVLEPSDVVVTRAFEHGDLNVYMPIIKFAHQYDNGYSIHSDRQVCLNTGRFRNFNYVGLDGQDHLNSDEDLHRYEDK